MNKSTFQLAGLFILSLLFFGQNMSFAQGYNRVFKFAKGDVYETEVLTNSSAIAGRGKQEMKVVSTTKLTKKYSVQSIASEKVNMSVEVAKLIADIDVNGVKTHFNSEESFDKSSTILNGISYMVKKPIALTLNNYGVVQDFQEYKMEMATDTLVSFAGIKPEIFRKSVIIGFLADLTYRKTLTKGTSWLDNSTIGDQSLTTRFVIEDVNEQTTVLKFTSRITSSSINTNSNGTYVIDNATGMIKEKYIYTVSAGYEISAGKVIYTVSRSTNTVEKTRKL